MAICYKKIDSKRHITPSKPQKKTRPLVKHHPIGIFDSGVGGLSVAGEIKRQMPFESIAYFADSTNCPYGSKQARDARSLAQKNIEFLLSLNCKIIVIACNTVTAIAIEQFRKTYPVPFIGMEPALKPATLLSKSRKIGVLATRNTLEGNHFKRTFEKYGQGVEVFAQEGLGLVELVESGAQESPEAESRVAGLISPMLDKGVDTIVLGCTHYPFLKRVIQKITNGKVEIVDPSEAVARQTRRVLEQFDILSDRQAENGFTYYTTGNATMTAERLLTDALLHPYAVRQITPDSTP